MDRTQGDGEPVAQGTGPDESELDPTKTSGTQASQDDDRSDAG